ncbi:MAG TPA: hypothetical protein PLS73_11080 [Saprospiraceae bacterium]|nr:hypothetical protein [Saprospiraceae bacterium]
MKNNKSIQILLFVLLFISWSCNQDTSTQSEAMNYNVSRINDTSPDIQNSINSLDVCNEPPTEALYLYSFGTNVFYITPKCDGSSGTQTIYAFGISCFPSQTGYTCDNGPNYSGVCCFTTNSGLSCTGSKYVVLDNIEYTVTPYVPINSPCIGSYMTFEFCNDPTDHLQSVRFCTNECFTIMCSPPDDCIAVDVYN